MTIDAAADVAAELRDRFPDVDWDAVNASPGRATPGEILEAMTAAGCGPAVIELVAEVLLDG